MLTFLLQYFTPMCACLRDVARSAKALRKAFKQCENPYRRGVVSAKQFQVGVPVLVHTCDAIFCQCSSRDLLTHAKYPIFRVLPLLCRTPTLLVANVGRRSCSRSNVRCGSPIAVHDTDITCMVRLPIIVQIYDAACFYRSTGHRHYAMRLSPVIAQDAHS